MRCLHSLLCSLLIGLAAAPAAADVALLFDGLGAGDPADLARVADELQHRGLGRVLFGSELRRRLAGPSAEELITRGRQLAEEGWILLGHLKLDKAIARLEHSLSILALGQSSRSACSAAADPLQALAFAEWQRGNKTRARVLAAKANRLGAAVDARRYPPAFQRFLAAAHEAPPLALSILSEPPGASVWVDCERKSRTPFRSALEGAALVQVELADHLPWGRLVIGGVDEGLFEVKLPPRPAQVAATSEPWRLQALAASARVDHIVLWRKGAQGIETRTYQAEAQLLTSWTVLAPSRPPEERPAIQTSLALARRTSGAWFWAGAAGSLALLATGTALTILATSAANRLDEAARAHEPFNDDLAGLEDRRDRLGPAGWVCLGVGAAGAVSTLVLWLALPADRPASPKVSVSPGWSSLRLSW